MGEWLERLESPEGSKFEPGLGHPTVGKLSVSVQQ